MTDELHLYQNGGPNGPTGSWTAIRPSGALYGHYSSKQEMELVLTANGFEKRKLLSLFNRKHDVWMRKETLL